MKIEDLSLAVFVDCPNCEGSGSVQERDSFFIDAETGKPITRTRCGNCHGHGKIPIFIPLAELEVKFEQDGWTRRSPSLEGNIGRWLEKQEETG